jgi:hypothetical protein
VTDDSPITYDDVPHHRPTAMARRAAWWLIGAIGLLVVVIVIAGLRQSTGDPGALSEATYALPPGVPVPALTDVSAEWEVDRWKNTSQSQLSGGASLGDLNGDGFVDLVIAGGTVGIFLNDGTRFELVHGANEEIPSNALSTMIADLDGDGLGDIVIGPESGDAVVVWGGPWLGSGDVTDAETSRLPGHAMTTGVLAGDLDNDGTTDLVLLGYGTRSASRDSILYNTGGRSFAPTDLPGSEGKSLAGQIADIDGDGLVDIWITRDLGWKSGADSLYSRDASGEWRDIAADLGIAMEIDGMGITVADLTGDGVLDGYLSDLGGNELLAAAGSRFESRIDSGAARIRPPDAAASTVSSSWGTGATDANLDGVVDLVVVNGGMPFFDVENKIPATRIEVNDPPAILLGLGDGTYADTWVNGAVSWTGAGRGLALGDIDNDGDTDLVISRLDDSPIVLRNDSVAQSIGVVPAPGCSPVGAVVSIPTEQGVVTQLLTASSFGGTHAPGVVVGQPVVGSPITVRWPGGNETQTVAPSEPRSTVVVDCTP